MDKIKFITFDNGKADTCHGCVYDGSFCRHPPVRAPICVGGIYVEEQKPVQQNVTEQEEQKRVKYVAIVLYDIVGVDSYSKCFDTLEEAEYHLETEYPDPDHISFEIVEMEY